MYADDLIRMASTFHYLTGHSLTLCLVVGQVVGTEQPMGSLRCSTILKLVVLVKVAVSREIVLTVAKTD